MPYWADYNDAGPKEAIHRYWQEELATVRSKGDLNSDEIKKVMEETNDMSVKRLKT